MSKCVSVNLLFAIATPPPPTTFNVYLGWANASNGSVVGGSREDDEGR